MELFKAIAYVYAWSIIVVVCLALLGIWLAVFIDLWNDRRK